MVEVRREYLEFSEPAVDGRENEFLGEETEVKEARFSRSDILGMESSILLGPC